MAPSRKEVSVKLPLKQVDPLPIGVVLYVIGALIMEESPWRRFSLFQDCSLVPYWEISNVLLLQKLNVMFAATHYLIT
jgi:hypothetical protein